MGLDYRIKLVWALASLFVGLLFWLGYSNIDQPEPAKAAGIVAYSLVLAFSLAIVAGMVLTEETSWKLATFGGIIGIPWGIFMADAAQGYAEILTEGIGIVFFLLIPFGILLIIFLLAWLFRSEAPLGFATWMTSFFLATAAIAAMFHLVTINHQVEESIRQHEEAPGFGVFSMLTVLLIANFLHNKTRDRSADS